MNFKHLSRIHIVGIYGTGKSTLSKKISELLKIKAYDLDEIKYKHKYDVVRSVPERLKIVKNISKKKFWITEGTWTSYALDLYKKADLVIFLEIPKYIIYKQILVRYFKRKFEKKIYQKSNLNTTLKLIKNVHDYFTDSNHFPTLNSHQKYLQKYAKRALVMRSKKDISKLLASLKSSH